MTRLLSILLLVCSAMFAQIQDIPGTEAVGVSRQKIVDNFNYLNTGKAVATIGTVLPGTCAYNAAGPVVLFVNTTGPTLSVCSAPNVWTQVAGGGSVTWGQLLGTLSNQADLAAALAGKAAVTHASSHQNGGADEIATATAAANAIPKAGAGGSLAAGWIPDLSGTYTRAADKTGSGSKIASAASVPPDGCANWAGGNLGSTGVACGTSTGGITDLVQDLTPQLGGDVDMNGHNLQTVTPTEMTYLHGVTSAIQTQLGGKVASTDPRLSDARTPTAHAGSHVSNGSDAIAAGTTTVRGTVTTTTSNSQAVSTDDSRMTNARTPTAHAASHQNGGADEVATVTAAANAIPKAGSGGKLAQAWIDFTGYQTSLGYTAENQANKSTNTALGTSDTLYPTQNAVKTYVDSHAGSGIVNQTTGTGPPSATCDATHNQPSASNLTVYTDTSAPAEWWCTGSSGWKRLLTADPSGTYVEAGSTGTAPANPAAGQVKCYFDSTAKTQICLDENGNAFIGVKGLAARVASQYMTYIDALGIQHQAQPDWADLTNKPGTFTPPGPGASTLGGITTAKCTAGNHADGYNSDGSPHCTADTGSGGGVGVGSQAGTLTFGNIADLVCADTSYSWTGLAAGTRLTADWSNAPASTIGRVWATANTVNGRLCNFSGGNLTAPSFSLTATIANYYLSGTATPGWSAIADMTCGTSPMTLTGVVAGDRVSLHWVPSATGLLASVSGTSTDTINLQVCNFNGATQTPSGSFSATVVK